MYQQSKNIGNPIDLDGLEPIVFRDGQQQLVIREDLRLSALMDGYVFPSVDSRGQFEEFLVIAKQLIDLEVHRWLVRAWLVVRVGVLLLIDVHALADFE